MSRSRWMQLLTIFFILITATFFQNCAEQDLGTPLNSASSSSSGAGDSSGDNSGSDLGKPMYALLSDASGFSGINRILAGSSAEEKLYNSGKDVLTCVEGPGVAATEFKCFEISGVRVLANWVFLSAPLSDGSPSGWSYDTESRVWNKVYISSETILMNGKSFRHHFYDPDNGRFSTLQFSVVQ